ncbi:ATP-binding protein [Roseateles sp.]|uniref:ATP-binding protein n=1 Tax=Roseateles sp. TaxID=1971397 RepID=UPI002F3E9FE3
MDLGISPTDTNWRIARNAYVTDLRIARIAEMYALAETELADVKAWAKAWRADPSRCPWLLLVGPVGTGKTHAAIAALRRAVLVPRTVRWEFATCAQMLDDLRPGGPDDADERYMRCDLLLIDDIAMVKANTEWAIEQIYRVIDTRRRNNRTTVITSNDVPARLKELLNEQIVSRIAQNCTLVALVGDDRRRAPKEA